MYSFSQSSRIFEQTYLGKEGTYKYEAECTVLDIIPRVSPSFAKVF
jgi:hypothetical protein